MKLKTDKRPEEGGSVKEKSYLALGLLLATGLTLSACSMGSDDNRANVDHGKDIKTAANMLKEPTAVKYPGWMLSPPANTVPACAKVYDGDIQQARTVAVAKAQAELAYSRSTKLNSTRVVNEQVSGSIEDPTVSNKVVQTVNMTTEGHIEHYEILQSEMVKGATQQEFCILYGMKK